MKALWVSTAVSVLMASCGLPERSGQARPSAYIDQVSGDITVVKSFNTRVTVTYQGNNGPGDVKIDLTNCRPLTTGTNMQIDCSEAAFDAMVQQRPSIAGPIAGVLSIVTDPGVSGLVAPSFFCTFQEIQTATREVALRDAVGIGFSYNGTLRTVPMSKLVQIGRAVSRSGEAMIIHRFQAPAYCWAGSATSSSRATYSFKPFLEFRGADGNVYHNWDAVPQNYVVSYSGAQGFDRSGEVLR